MNGKGPPVEWLQAIWARHYGDEEVGAGGRKHVDREKLLEEYAELWDRYLAETEHVGKLQIRIAELEKGITVTSTDMILVRKLELAEARVAELEKLWRSEIDRAAKGKK